MWFVTRAHSDHSLRVNGLPAGQEDIVLCNFNKVDKIDPETFATWMAVRAAA